MGLRLVNISVVDVTQRVLSSKYFIMGYSSVNINISGTQEFEEIGVRKPNNPLFPLSRSVFTSKLLFCFLLIPKMPEASNTKSIGWQALNRLIILTTVLHFTFNKHLAF